MNAEKKKTSIKEDNPKAGAKNAKKEFKAGNKPDKKRCFNCGSPEHDVKNCTDVDKGPKYFKYNCFRHVASKCDVKTNPSLGMARIAVSCINSVDDKFITIDIDGQKFLALLDTENDVSFMRDDLHKNIGELKLNRTMRAFTGLGNVTTKLNDTFPLKLAIGSNSYNIEVFVIPANSIISNLILGRDFLRNVEVIIRRGQIEVKRLPIAKSATTEGLIEAEEEDSENHGLMN